MAKASLSLAQMSTMRSLRTLDEDLAKSLRSSMFTAIKEAFEIPADHRVKVEIDEESAPNFGVIIRKNTGEAYTLTSTGVWNKGTPAPESTPQATGKVIKGSRWFKVDRADIAHSVIDGGRKFTDGQLDAPYGDVVYGNGSDEFQMIDDGDDLWIKLNLVEDDTDRSLTKLIKAMLSAMKVDA